MSYDSGIIGVGILSADILNDIVREAERAHELHGNMSMRYGSDARSLRILMEEVGEVAKAMNEEALGKYENTQAYIRDLRKELIQVAAMAATWIKKLD